MARIGLRAHVLAVALLLLALALIYGRAGGFGYVDYDDVDYVVRTLPVRAGLTVDGVRWAFSAFHLGNWHPLTWISHMLDVSLFGLDPGPAHLVNVALHGLNSVLVYLLALALLRNWPASLVVAFLFLVHPLHVESVAWIAERKDLLCALFFLLSMLAYLAYAARPGARRYALVLCAFALALLAKPMAVTLPVVLMLLDFWPLGRWRAEPALLAGRRFPAYAVLVAEKIPLFALSAGSALITLAAQKGAIASMDVLSPGYRMENSVLAYAIYLRDTLVPTRLALLYPLGRIDFVEGFLPSLLLLVALSAAAFAWRKRCPWLLFGWLWFLVTLLPVIGLVQVGLQSHADRYMYLPSLGLFLALAAALARLNGSASTRALLALAPLLVFYSFMAWVQFGYWSGPYMLFSRTLEVAGESYPIHAGLAGFYLREGQVQEAEKHALRALALSPNAPLSYALVGFVRAAKKDAAGAEQMFRAALSKSPGDAQMLHSLGAFLAAQGRADQAKPYLDAAAKAAPALYKASQSR